MTKRVLLIFPPNWAACTSGPHLAMPLLAGGAKRLGWEVETWDLSEEFYRTYAVPPSRSSLFTASSNENFDALDQLYFNWEDQLRMLPLAGEDGKKFGLLSGYHFGHLNNLRLADVRHKISEGTVYSDFIKNCILPRLIAYNPSLIGITIASQEQMIPALELLLSVRAAMPEAFLILGGNVVSRLRNTSAFTVLTSLADQTVVFQGDLAFADAIEAISEYGVRKSRELLSETNIGEFVPHQSWAIPYFNGIDFKHSVGTPVLPYVSTRGCYWGKCHFCAIPDGWSSKGYGGSAPGDFIAGQIAKMVVETGIPRVKFVDEAIPPNKVRTLSRELYNFGITVEWEGYARLEPAWENVTLLEEAYVAGLRKLYFGLEQAPSTNRIILGKNDSGDPLRTLRACNQVGIKVHLFCMVGHPGSSYDDAKATVDFLIDNESLIDTSDLVGFRLDRGTQVPGVEPLPSSDSDWTMSLNYRRTHDGVLSQQEVNELEFSCQEELWERVPRLLHPLYRIVGNWKTNTGQSGAIFHNESKEFRDDRTTLR